MDKLAEIKVTLDELAKLYAEREQLHALLASNDGDYITLWLLDGKISDAEGSLNQYSFDYLSLCIAEIERLQADLSREAKLARDNYTRWQQEFAETSRLRDECARLDARLDELRKAELAALREQLAKAPR